MSRLGIEALIHACSFPVEMSSSGCQSVDKQNCTLDIGSKKLLYALENDEATELGKLCNETTPQVIFRDYDSGKILHVAARLGGYKVSQVLLNHDMVKADIEAPDDKGRTALLVSVISAQSKALEKLLTAGANVNARDDDHYGVLHLLLLELSKDKKTEKDREKLMEVADLLLPIRDGNPRPFPLDTLDLEPHANLAVREDATPLSAASAMVDQGEGAPWINNIIILCEKLIKVGADYSEVEDELQSHAIDFNYRETRLPERKLDLKVIDEFCRGNEVNLEEELSQSQSKDAQKDAVNSRIGRHSLLFLAVDKSFKMVQILLEFGANPRVEGNLPIERAAEKGFSSIFELLFEKMKPTISPDDIDRLTHVLEDMETDGHKKCLRLIEGLQVQESLDHTSS